LREARADELDAVGAMMVAAYAEFAPPAPVPAWTDYEDEIRDVRRRLGVSTLIVVDDGGRLVGAVRLLAVHPAARGRGLGRLLTEECIRRARASGRAAVGLHTTTLMNVARAMYERMGFVRVPEHDFLPMPTFRVMAYRLTL
jgi:ribosomal protein S18 acetylase RimI-like enzyme